MSDPISGSEPVKTDKPRKQSSLFSLFSGLAVVVFILVIGIGLNSISGFIDFPSGLFSFGILAGVMIAGIGYRRSLLAVRVIIFQKAACEKDRQAAIDFSALGWKANILVGLLGTLTALVNMLSGGMDDVNAMTAGAAVSLLTFVYSVIIAILFLIGGSRAKAAIVTG